MAKYTVTAGCGHTTEVQLYGSARERDNRLAWMRSPTGACNACYATSKREQEATERDRAVAEYAEQAVRQVRERTLTDDEGMELLRKMVREAVALNPAAATTNLRVMGAIRAIAVLSGQES